MTSAAYHRIDFFSALSGLMLEPGITTERLLSEEYPRFGLTIFLLFLCSAFLPIFGQSLYYGYPLYHLPVMLGLIVVVTMTTLLFLLTEGVFLVLLGIEFSPERLFACIAYSLAPALVALWIIYGFNYLAEGRLSIITVLTTGEIPANDAFLAVLPWGVAIVQVMGLLVFYYALRTATGLGVITGFFASVFSLCPLYAAFIISLRIADIAHPGTGDSFFRLVGL